MNDILSYENLILYPSNQTNPISTENYDVIQVRTIHHIFVLFQTVADKTVRTIDIKLLVICRYNIGCDLVKYPDFGSSFLSLAIFLDRKSTRLNSSHVKI